MNSPSDILPRIASSPGIRLIVWADNDPEWEDDSIDIQPYVVVVDGVLWTEGTAGSLNADEWDWTSAEKPLLGQAVAKFKPLITRVEQAQVDKIIEESKQV